MKNLTKEEGLMLYWCEGSKFKYSVYVNNTNPIILKLFMGWLEEYYGVKRKDFKIFLHLWTSKIKTDLEIKNKWKDILGVEISQFRKTYFKPTKLTKVGDKYPLGTCRVRINSKIIAEKIKKDINQTFE